MGTTDSSWTQAVQSACNLNYTTPPGEPCVPGGGDLACSDLAPWGISQAYVVGKDVYGFDRDGDGTGCETGLPREATRIGDLTATIAPYAIPVVLIAFVAALLVGVRYLRTLFESSESTAEKRNYKFSVMLLVVTTLPAALLGALGLALVGLH